MGPLLFVIYVSEISQLLRSKVRLFADDSKVWRKVTSPDDQKIADRSQEWSETWLLKLNVDKCQQFNISKPTGNQYCIGNDTNKKKLQLVEKERDLGVVFTSDLKRGTQCQRAAARAMSVLGMIK